MTWRIPFLRNFFLLGLLALGGSCQFDAPASEGEVFRYNEPTAIGSLDPAFASDQAHGWLSKQLFSTLVDSDSTLSPVPQLERVLSLLVASTALEISSRKKIS